MIVDFHETYINLRGENDEERKVLKEMYVHGIRAWGGGSYLSFSPKEPIDIDEEMMRKLELFSECTAELMGEDGGDTNASFRHVLNALLTADQLLRDLYSLFIEKGDKDE